MLKKEKLKTDVMKIEEIKLKDGFTHNVVFLIKEDTEEAIKKNKELSEGEAFFILTNTEGEKEVYECKAKLKEPKKIPFYQQFINKWSKK